jgi:hypothetical protein
LRNVVIVEVRKARREVVSTLREIEARSEEVRAATEALTG